MSARRVAVAVTLLIASTRVRPASADPEPRGGPWRLEMQSVHHFSASGDSARLLNGLGVAVAWRLRPRWTLVGAIHAEGSAIDHVAHTAIPVGAAVRFSLVERGRWDLFARAGLTIAGEWVEIGTVAGTAAREEFMTTRLDGGAGFAWSRGRYTAGAELRLLSQHRWESFGDAPDHPEGGGEIPRRAAGGELGLIAGMAF